jgi:hypothetical protein
VCGDSVAIVSECVCNEGGLGTNILCAGMEKISLVGIEEAIAKSR